MLQLSADVDGYEFRNIILYACVFMCVCVCLIKKAAFLVRKDYVCVFDFEETN